MYVCQGVRLTGGRGWQGPTREALWTTLRSLPLTGDAEEPCEVSGEDIKDRSGESQLQHGGGARKGEPRGREAGKGAGAATLGEVMN